MTLKTQRTAAIWGFIVGDAMGVPYEFSEREIMNQNPAVKMIGYGTHNQPIGTWSDDTSMLLCVVENLKKQGGLSDLANLFTRWYKHGHHTAHGEIFDIGNTTLIAIEKLIDGIHPTKSGEIHEYSAGNGSLMRCLPYAYEPDFKLSMIKMLLDSRITHNTTICNECCLFYTKVHQALILGKNKEESVKEGINILKPLQHSFNELFNKEENRFSDNCNRLSSDQFKYIPENDIQSTGYVLHTLEAVIWCFLNSNSYSAAVLKAINLGGDTDSIAALTGGLAASYYGYESIEKKWIEMIVRKNEIEKIIF